MIIKVDIDTDNLLEHTTRQQDEKIGAQFIRGATDEVVIDELVSRGLVEDVLETLTKDEIEKLFEKFTNR